MGFISFGILGELFKTLPVQAIGLLILGGAVYCLGVFFYVKKKGTLHPCNLAFIRIRWG
jgi:hemolysin III